MEWIVRIIAVPSLPHWYLMTLIDHRHLHHAGPGWAKHYAPGIRISSMSAKS
jgi:hypothetical protein